MFQIDSTSLRHSLEGLLRVHLWMKLLVALALGVAAGFLFLRIAQKLPGPWYLTAADWLALPGSIYLTVIQMVIVPLILSSIILSLAEIGQKQEAKQIVTSSMIFVFTSTVFAAALGIAVMTILRPGDAIHETARSLGTLELSAGGALKITPQSILQLIPVNPLASLLSGDLLEVLIVALIFGLVISRMDRSKVQTLLDFLEGTQALCMKIITWTVKLAPYAVFGLMIRAVVTSGAGVILGMMGYVACTFLGFVLMMAAYLVWLKMIGVGSWSFIKATRENLLLAFSLSSSAATMPNTLRTAKESLQINPEIAELIVPLGTSINMAGSALWQTSATFFLAQAFGGAVEFPVMLTIIFLTIGASIGTPGVPGAGVGVLNTTLRSVGVPATGIPLILGVDRLVDMGCTVINVMGDLVMCCTAQWLVDRTKEKTISRGSEL